MEVTGGKDTTMYKVVVNQEEQYSIWPADQELPKGWTETGKQGLKAECLTFIKDVWTDMTPASVRKHMGRKGSLRNGHRALISGIGSRVS
nr:hypothetical protein Hi04_10k_c1170_00016 [uncultured bacterium]